MNRPLFSLRALGSLLVMVGCSSSSLAVVEDGQDASLSHGLPAKSDAATADAGATHFVAPDGATEDASASTRGVDASKLTTKPDASKQDATVTRLDAASPDATSTTPDTSPAFDAGSCPSALPDGGFWPYDTPASGFISGPDVGAHICNAAADVLTNQNGTFLEINSYDGTTSVDFTKPHDTEDALLSILVPAGASPGVYTSGDAVNCGNIGFDYALPPPAGLDCSGTTPPMCPAGCVAACSGLGCEPCSPNPPSFGYLASGETGGICAEVYPQPGTLSGSWRITLTSVMLYGGPAAPTQHYIVHGSLSAKLSGGGGDASDEPATLSLEF